MKEFFKIILYKPLYNILIFLAWLVPGHSIGWAIIILTIIIRLILLPSSIKAAKAQAKMQMLQPKVNKIRQEIKDQQEQGRALMKLYKDEDVSPFGSCLPMLIQLPIIFILYRVFTNGLNESRYSYIYSFVPHMDTVNTYFFGLDLASPEKWILPILAGGTQLILSRMTMATMPPASKDKNAAPDPTAMMSKQMMYLLPLFTLFFARTLPAALALYWTATTLFGIGQQYYVNNVVKNEKKNTKVDDDLNIDEYKNLPPVNPESKQKTETNKSEMVTKLMNKRLDKQEKKSGVEVTIRKKN